MSYELVYGSFSGPMDVLLDLIKKREMDIYDIQIHVLVDDFLAYLDGMASTISYADHMQQGTLSMVAETSAPYGSDK